MALNLNRWVGAGRVCADPVLETKGEARAPFVALRLAVNRKYRDRDQQLKEETTFCTIECWGPNATYAAQYVRKGSEVLIQGRLKWDSWEGKDGLKHSTVKVTCDELSLAGSVKAVGASSAGAGGPPAPQTATSEKPF